MLRAGGAAGGNRGAYGAADAESGRVLRAEGAAGGETGCVSNSMSMISVLICPDAHHSAGQVPAALGIGPGRVVLTAAVLLAQSERATELHYHVMN